MKKNQWKRIAALALAAVTTVSMVGCGKKAQASKTAENYQVQSGPYYDKGFDLKDHETITMYVLGDRPKDMDEVLKKANDEYFGPNLNVDLDVEFLNWSDYQTKYPLLLSGGEKVDLIYTASWCFMNEEISAGAFKELDKDFLKTYMPYTYDTLPSQAWDQISVGGKVYAAPKGKVSFTNYSMLAAREDLIEKYNLTKPTSWDNFKSYLTDLAKVQSETGVTPLNTNANREQLLTMYEQSQQVQNVTEGHDFIYHANNSEDAPAVDGIEYLYMSDVFENYAKEMAELANKGAWSSDAINDTTDPQSYFENGTSGAFVWNGTIFAAGKNMEDAGNGKYEVYDVTSDVKRATGSYATDATAITTKCQNPERAALTLDYMKSDVDLNRLLLGGIEGKHWKLEKDGTRSTLDDAEKYSWNSWAWALNRQDEPDESTLDPRQIAAEKHNCEMEFVPKQTGFTFDPSSVQDKYSAVSAVVDEYRQSFALGIYGDATVDKVKEFREQLKSAGIEDVTKEFKSQYEAYMSAK
ncbi:MAG: ABC transporter substrate-binding protein [Lachnospiraceae bacterium]|nr:ABC transporter substrate-binding protein [Lachnospiraceae bacterium]